MIITNSQTINAEKSLKISQLLSGIQTSIKEDSTVLGLSCDSRTLKPGECFFALKGFNEDGHLYIADAISKGAAAVIIDASMSVTKSYTVPVIAINNLSSRLGEIAANFYDHPAKKMTMVGVTGTNGKTSTSQYIAMAMNKVSAVCGVVGTLGYGLPENLVPSTHTTPNALVLQSQLATLKGLGAKTVAMEVSSHALDQGRVAGIQFDIAIFTNLTRDHLDYHGSMEDYAAVKKKLFYTAGLKQAVINTDDPFGVTLAEELSHHLPVTCYGVENNGLELPMVKAHHLHLNTRGMTAKINSPWGEGQIRSSLIGRFNMSNLLAVFTTLQLLGVPFETALSSLTQLHTVAGRMQVFGGGKLPLVVVDYAHTPDALMQVLTALREHTHGVLWCLFGCGGDRDRGKRPMMAQIAERYADQVVITDDNPRSEDPALIVADMMPGFLCPWAVEIEHDRSSAIAHVISCAQPNDVVLVAGKGHEAYQIIGNEKIPFSDSEHIQAQLRLRQKNS